MKLTPLADLTVALLDEADAAADPERQGELRRIGVSLAGWLGTDSEERLSEVDVLAALRTRAFRATAEARAAPGDLALEARRRVCWRVVFQVAEALRLDPFGRTREQVAAREVAEAPRSRGGCEGICKDGRRCQGRPKVGTLFCHQHQEQGRLEALPATADEAGPEGAAGVGADGEAAFFAEAERVLAGGLPAATIGKWEAA